MRVHPIVKARGGRWRPVIVALGLLASARAEASEPSAVTVERVAASLSGIEDIPSPERLRTAFGAELGPALARLSTDRQQPRWVRARALSRLAAVDAAACEAAAKAVLAEPDLPRVLARYAAASWIEAAPRAPSTWTELTEDPRPIVRAEAARGLGRLRVGRPDVEQKLAEMRDHDPSPLVREAAAAALAVAP